MAEIEEGQGDAQIWLPNIDDFLFLWQTTETAQKDKGTLRPASGRFRRKRTKYLSNKVEEMSDFNTYERPSRSI